MKETIMYYYKIYPEEVHSINNGCYFYYGDYKYYFLLFDRSIEEIELLVKISNDLYNKNVLVNTFIDSNNSFYVSYDHNNYVLLRVNSVENDIYTLEDLLVFNNYLISKDKSMTIDWNYLWSEKIDLLEEKVSEFNKEHPIIQESFSYYVGLAENAISYFIDSKSDFKDDVKINLNHKRIPVDMYSGIINNPLNFTFDYDVRDISEYIKTNFFEDKDILEEIKDIIDSKIFSKTSIKYLFSRLLYPSYYFDMVENILLYENDEKKLLKYINLSSEYESFLIEIYYIIKRVYDIIPIEWLNNDFNY